MGDVLKLFLTFALILLTSSAVARERNLDRIYSRTEFQLGAQKFSPYVADTEKGREDGLMYITKLADNTGMLFVFEEERPLAFWMKNTLIPLAIGFFDHEGVLIDIQEMKVAASIMELSPPSYPSKGPALFALEMNTGWFTKHKIKTGSRLVRLAKSPSKLLEEKLPFAAPTRH